VGDGTEPCGATACISLGVDISSSTETLNFLCERKELISKPHTLKCRFVTGTETKQACIKYAFFSNVPLDYFQNNFPA
jgi:hypothetical protein